MIGMSRSKVEERLAIAQVDGRWPNLALAKIAASFNDVSFFSPLEGADVVYASKVFLDTPDDPYLPENTVRGGSGYDLKTKLPEEIERMKPDWSLWPEWTKDIGYSTRGCIRRCAFCNVREKDGDLRVVAEFADLTTGRSELILYDSNIIAAPMEHFKALCRDATKAHVRLNFSQGLDARLLTEEHAAILRKSCTVRRKYFAFDHVGDEEAVRRAVKIMVDAGFHLSDMTFYVLIGFDSNPEEDLYRAELLRDIGVDPFVMPYDRHDPYQRRFARWVNNYTAFHAMTWPEWQKRFKTPL